MKEEILKNISNYLDSVEIRDGNEGAIHTNSLYLQYKNLNSIYNKLSLNPTF